MKTIFINGLGLIGSSIARIIRKSQPTSIILGNDIDQKNCDNMLEQHIINQQIDFANGAKQADVIILATPVNNIIKSIDELNKLTLKPSVIITDVGSSKVAIQNAASSLIHKGITFIGGHPMAGSHLTGSENGSIEILKNHNYFLTTHDASDKPINTIQSLLSAGQFKFKCVTPSKHDQIVSIISHLPHLIAYSLTLSVDNELKDKGATDIIAGNGLLDTTRIAKSDPGVWSSILKSNADNLLDQIENFKKQLDSLEQMIENHQFEKIREEIKKANIARQSWE